MGPGLRVQGHVIVPVLIGRSEGGGKGVRGRRAERDESFHRAYCADNLTPEVCSEVMAQTPLLINSLSTSVWRRKLRNGFHSTVLAL